MTILNPFSRTSWCWKTLDQISLFQTSHLPVVQHCWCEWVCSNGPYDIHVFRHVFAVIQYAFDQCATVKTKRFLGSFDENCNDLFHHLDGCIIIRVVCLLLCLFIFQQKEDMSEVNIFCEVSQHSSLITSCSQFGVPLVLWTAKCKCPPSSRR